jgi:hypothetical protein
VGSLYFADSPSLSNPHNTNGGYSVIYKGCWTGTTFMHEVGHNRGAVQPAAPHSTGDGAHCNDGNDVMCYAPDGGNRNQFMTHPCPSVTLFDCGYDDYFDAALEPGEFLANHWNVGTTGQNFLAIIAGEPEPPEDTTPPETAITVAPANRTTERRATFEFSGTDDTSAPAALTYECSLDRAAFAACSSGVVYSGLTTRGHLFRVRGTDEAGNVESSVARFRWRILR